jgi:hypothetical protein
MNENKQGKPPTSSGSALIDLLAGVSISDKSIRYIKDIFSKYTETGTLPDVIENVVIHMYPKEDTTPNDDDLNGYEDSIFSEVKIYMPKSKTVFIVPRLCDAVFVAKRNNIRIFKDGSTCISISGKLSIDIGQAIHVDVVDS